VAIGRGEGEIPIELTAPQCGKLVMTFQHAEGDPAVDPPQLGCCEVGGRLEIAPLVLVGPVVSHLATHPRERELVSRRGDVRQLTERSPTNRLLPNVDAVVDAFSEAARIAQVVPILLEDDSIVLFVVVAVVEGCQDTQLLLALLTHAPSHAAD